MQNLREQLLKAGLINEDQAKKADKEVSTKPRAGAPRPQQRGERPERAERPPQRAERAERGARPPQQSDRKSARPAPIPKLPPLAVPNNKEFQRLEAKRQVDLDRAIRELVLGSQLTFELGEQTFYFVTRKNKLRRMQLTPEIAQRLENGELAVVERPDPGQIEHAVVPAEIAEKILALQEKSVRFFNRKEQPVGFLSDDELARRQQAEARSAAATTEEKAEEPTPEFSRATDPEGAEEVDAHVEKDSETESIAQSAERTSTRVIPEHESGE